MSFKQLLGLAIVAVMLGGGYYYYQGKKAAEAKAQAEAQARAEAAAKAQAEAKAKAEAAEAARLKAIADAKAKAEAARVAAETKARAEAEAKAKAEAADPVKQLVRLEQDYSSTETQWEPLKRQLAYYRAARSAAPEAQSLDQSIADQAKALKKQIADLRTRAVAVKKQANSATVTVKRVKTGLNAGGSKNDKYSGWYYADSPKMIFPMNELSTRNRKRKIAYVSKQQENIATAADQASGAANQYLAQHRQLTDQITTAERQYFALRERLIASADAKIAEVQRQAEPVLKKRKDLRRQIETLQSSTGEVAKK